MNPTDPLSPLHDSGSIPSRGGVFQAIFPWLITCAAPWLITCAAPWLITCAALYTGQGVPKARSTVVRADWDPRRRLLSLTLVMVSMDQTSKR